MFSFRRKTKKNDDQQTANTPVAEVEPVKTAQSAKPAAPIQKRNHFRLDCEIPAMTKLISRNELRQITLGEPHDSVINNLSSGGVGLMANINLNDKDRILISFKLENDLIALTGEMKFKSNHPDPEYLYQYGIMFTGTSTKDQDIICKYLFKMQMNSFS